MGIWILIFLVFVLALISILILLITQYRIEVKPATALVYNNQWTGKTSCVLPGTDILVPGIHKVLEKEVSLRNEAQDPSKVAVITADGIEIEVDFIIRRLQVGYPKMPPEFKDQDKKLLKKAVVKAVVAIDYKDHVNKILSRILAQLKESVGKHAYNSLFVDSDLEKGEPGKFDENKKDVIKKEVNEELLKDVATIEWGFWVEMDLENISLPEGPRKTREQSASAKMAGQAIADKSKAAGISPSVLVIADALSGLFKGGGK